MDRSRISKRKAAPLRNLQRRVRARRDEPEPEDVSSQEESGSEDGRSGQDSEDGSDDDDEHDEESDLPSEEDDDRDEDEDVDDEYSGTPRIDASQISFGALAKAQSSLPNARRKKKGPHGRGDGDDDNDDDDDNDSDDSGPEEVSSSKNHLSKAKPKIGRTNKHAPAEQSSKKPVSRRREVVAVPQVSARDPRFDPATAGPVDEDKARRAYAFLDEYRDAEMARLQEALRKTPKADAAAREELKRALASMQDRRKAQRRRDDEKALLAEHRRREKDLVRQGKKSAPFYLKRSEQRKQLLVDRFAAMKGKEADRAIERRRKKLASKEKKDMPFARRERS